MDAFPKINREYAICVLKVSAKQTMPNNMWALFHLRTSLWVAPIIFLIIIIIIINNELMRTRASKGCVTQGQGYENRFQDMLGHVHILCTIINMEPSRLKNALDNQSRGMAMHFYMWHMSLSFLGYFNASCMHLFLLGTKPSQS